MLLRATFSICSLKSSAGEVSSEPHPYPSELMLPNFILHAVAIGCSYIEAETKPFIL